MFYVMDSRAELKKKEEAWMCFFFAVLLFLVRVICDIIGSYYSTSENFSKGIKKKGIVSFLEAVNVNGERGDYQLRYQSQGLPMCTHIIAQFIRRRAGKLVLSARQISLRIFLFTNYAQVPAIPSKRESSSASLPPTCSYSNIKQDYYLLLLNLTV